MRIYGSWWKSTIRQAPRLQRDDKPMGNFLENVLGQLQRAADGVVVREGRGHQLVSVTGRELLELVGRARGSLREHGIEAGDRCALLGPNSIQWIAFDLALMC